MTEADWLVCDDPSRMLTYLFTTRKDCPRTFRLFACACCRLLGPLLGDEADRRMVETAERFADGLATEAQLSRAYSDAAVGPARHTGHPSPHLAAFFVSGAAANRVALYSRDGADGAEHHTAQCRLLRCLFGNPFRTVPLDPHWLAWEGGTVTGLAEGIYEGRRFGDLPILADALEEAGCDNPRILGHCREGGPHARGCWLIDLLMERS